MVPAFNQCQQIRHGKDPVGVEFDPLRADGNGEVEFAATLKHPVNVLPAGQMAPVIDPVPVAAQTEVLQGVEAGGGITVVCQREIRVHQVGALE